MITHEDKIKCWVVILFAFISHLPLINLYPVNFEFTFSEGAKYLINFDKEILKNYFFNQANTFTYSFLVGLINKIFPIENVLIYTRLLSATSYFFLGIAFTNIFSYFKIKLKCYYFLIFFFLNPIIWTYGYRGIPDLFCTSLAIFSFSKIIFNNYKKYKFKNFFNYFLLSISICIKPFCLIYLGLIVLLDYNNNLYKLFKKYLLTVLLTLVIPIIYLYIIKYNFNFYLIPSNFKSQVTFIHSNVIYTFFGYLVFLSILVFPMTLDKKNLKKRNIFLIGLLIFLSFFFYNIISTPNAELNFGFFQNLIDIRIISVIAFIFLSIFLIFFLEIFKKKKILDYKFIIIIFIYILILSFTRPAQRYLITILPIVFLVILKNLKFYKINLLSLFIIIIYVPLNLLITLNFYFTAYNNETIISYLRTEKLISKTDPGNLYPHSYHFFSKDLTKREYIISDIPGKSFIKSFHFNNIINQKYYYINKL